MNVVRANRSMEASYTVEATFVVSICVWILFALLYSGVYVHDRMVISSVTNEMTATRFQNGRKKVTDAWTKKVKKKLNEKLFFLQVKKVTGAKKLATVDVKVKYSLPLPLSLIKKLYVKKDGKSFSTTRELVKPVEYRWDADLLKKE